jgi:hypothetical protein
MKIKYYINLATQFDGPNKNISQICTDFSDQFSQLTKILTEINSKRIEKYAEVIDILSYRFRHGLHSIF